MCAERIHAVAEAVDRFVPSGSEWRDDLVSELERLVEKAVRQERERCAHVCRERAAVWRRTPSAHAPMELAREEARARANEAAYLADMIAEGRPLMAGADEDEVN